jgi:hypothetical protein
MAAPIRVLLVDDKEDYCKSLSGPARHKNIQIAYYLDWETGFEALKNDSKIEFVILDGKGKIEADQETERDNFVIRAMQDIERYAKKINKDIPYCVNTAFMERFEALEGNVTIFEKNDVQREKMFQFIVDEVTQSKYRTLRIPFEEAFTAFDIGIISKTYETLLIEIIESFNSKDFRKKNMNVQRDLFEAILKSLNTPIPCIPASLFKDNGAPIHEWCTRYMEDRLTRDGNQTEHKINLPIPKSIKSAFRKLKESTNEYSHLSDETVVKIPFLANTFLLMEVLEWLPGFVETNYKNYI